MPIYFFTLVGAYKYGYTVGLSTAILSPIINNLLFGMPPTAVLPVILVKSVVLAIAAATVAAKSRKVSIIMLAVTVVAYQLVGSLAEWGMTSSLDKATQDLIIGWPGMLLQVVAGYLVLRYILKK